jgi:hypothetical protein
MSIGTFLSLFTCILYFILGFYVFTKNHYCPIHLEFKVQLSVKTNISFFDSGRLGS